MPASFPTDFRAAELAFNTSYDSFLQAEETARIGTEDKVTANNNQTNCHKFRRLLGYFY